MIGATLNPPAQRLTAQVAKRFRGCFRVCGQSRRWFPDEVAVAEQGLVGMI